MLQEKEFTRVGGTSPVRVDVRIIAATNKRLESQMQQGKFREDLYYRLNVLTLVLPPLRDHREDIPPYVRHFIAKHREAFRKPIEGITEDALGYLAGCDWNGNVRELENAVQRAMLSATGPLIGRPDLEGGAPAGLLPDCAALLASGMESYVQSIVERTEKDIILKALGDSAWNRTEAAERLKISRKTLFNKMQQYGLRE